MMTNLRLAVEIRTNQMHIHGQGEVAGRIEHIDFRARPTMRTMGSENHNLLLDAHPVITWQGGCMALG